MFLKLKPELRWDWTETLINQTNTLLQVIKWQNENMGKKPHEYTDKPVPFEPDFMKSAKPKDPGSPSYSTDEVALILSRPRAS